MSTSPEYGEVLAYLRGARAALARAENTLGLVGPREQQPGALDDLVVGIQTSAELIGRRTGTNERERVRKDGAAAAAGVPGAAKASADLHPVLPCLTAVREQEAGQ